MTTKRKVNYGTSDLEKEIGLLTFGNMLESYRLAHDCSQKDFATELGISASSLCDLEKGRKVPTINRAMLIAQMLGVSEKLWIQAAIQDQINREDLNLEVSITEAS